MRHMIFTRCVHNLMSSLIDLWFLNDTAIVFKLYYERSKQKVRHKVGPLENNIGNIISDVCQKACVLNEYFSLVFTTEDTGHYPNNALLCTRCCFINKLI